MQTTDYTANKVVPEWIKACLVLVVLFYAEWLIKRYYGSQVSIDEHHVKHFSNPNVLVVWAPLLFGSAVAVYKWRSSLAWRVVTIVLGIPTIWFGFFLFFGKI